MLMMAIFEINEVLFCRLNLVFSIKTQEQTFMVINYSITPKNLKFGKRYPLLYIDKISLGFRKINPRKYIETKELL
jgi:hypothetical protein